MEKVKNICVLSVLFVVALCGEVCADLYVDTAPNYSGSPDWDPWWEQTKADVTGGTFTDLRSVTNTNLGPYTISPYDEIVYSTGDMGNRIHWIYWMPGENTAGLDDRFEVKWVIDCYGTNYTMDWSTQRWTADSPEQGWTAPTNWEDYDNGQGDSGVIGSFSFAWRADDDYAKPFNTDSDAYNETDQADINAMYEVALMYQTFATGYIRLRPTVDDEWQYTQILLTVEPAHTPVPAAVLLAMLGLSVAGYKLRKHT